MVAPSSARESLKINGTRVPSTELRKFGNGAWSYGQLNVAPGPLSLEADQPIAATIYGLGNVDSYSYGAGTKVRGLVQTVESLDGSSDFVVRWVADYTRSDRSVVTFRYESSTLVRIQPTVLNILGVVLGRMEPLELPPGNGVFEIPSISLQSKGPYFLQLSGIADPGNSRVVPFLFP